MLIQNRKKQSFVFSQLKLIGIKKKNCLRPLLAVDIHIADKAEPLGRRQPCCTITDLNRRWLYSEFQDFTQVSRLLSVRLEIVWDQH